MNPLRMQRNEKAKRISHLRNSIWILFSIVLIFSLSSCKPITRYDQPYSTGQLLLTEGMSIGQTFVARQAGLTGISVYFAPQQTTNESKDSYIILHLRADTESQVDIAVTQLRLKAIKNPRYYFFSFSPQPDSIGHYYYAFLEIQGEGGVNIRTSTGDAYLEGALYHNNIPKDNQMTFGLSYDPVLLCEGFLKIAFFWLTMLLAGCFLLIIPGWAILSWLWDGWKDITWVSKLGLSAGTSLVIYPILMLWTNLIRLQAGWFIAWLPPLGGSVYLIIKNFMHLKSLKNHKIDFRVIQVADLCTIAVILLLLISRLWPIINLDGPMWGDSYQHTVITQLIIDNHGLFNSWQPYAELVTFTYHYGFHSTAAAFHWITGLPAKEAVLWSGQLLNILAIIAIYPLAVKIGKNKWSGLAALLIAGIFSPMPATYINWGRYTQLAGQIILPAAVYLLWNYLGGKNLDWRLVFLNWIIYGGLALTHYRVLIFTLLFIPAYLILNLRRNTILIIWSRLFWVGMGAGLLFLPWFGRVFGGGIWNIFSRQLTTPPNSISSSLNNNAIGSLSMYLPAWLWVLFVISIGLGIWKYKKETTMIVCWWIFVFLAANPGWLRLPGTGALTNFAVFIAVYIPAGILIGIGVGWLIDRSRARVDLLTSSASLVLLFVLIPVILFYTRQRLSEAKTAQYALLTRPDLRAFDWVKKNTPQNAVFLVNSFLAYSGSTAVGSDAGWWLPLLTNRNSTLPPMNYGTEQAITPDYKEGVKLFPTIIQAGGINDPRIWDVLKEFDISYIYIGQRHGRVNYSGTVIEPEIALTNQHFNPVYHQDQVWIFEVTR